MNDVYSQSGPPVMASPSLGPKRYAMPWDLSEWVSRSQLWQWTVEEVDRLGWDKAELQAYLGEHPKYQPRALLSILSYAYSIGVFEDGEAADLPVTDPVVRAALGSFMPNSREVTNFRRANRGLIKWVLVEVFRRVLRERFELEGPIMPAGLKRHLVRAASARLELARMMVRATEEA